MCANANFILYRYDPVANKWSFGPSMIKGRESFGLIADRTRLYAFGGYVAYVSIRY